MNRIILTLLLSVLMVPIAVLSYLYSAIFGRISFAVKMKVMGTLETKDEINLESNPEINEQENETGLDELRIAFTFSKGLFVMNLMYLFTILPMCFTMIADTDQEWPAYIHLYPWLFYRLCSAATPIVYPLFHSSIRRGYKQAIDRFVLRKKKLLIKPIPKPAQKRKKIMETKL